MDELILAIERKLPELKWLVRSTEDGPDRENIGGTYFAHIYGRSDLYAVPEPSFEGVGDTPWKALNSAFCKAIA